MFPVVVSRRPSVLSTPEPSFPPRCHSPGALKDASWRGQASTRARRSHSKRVSWGCSDCCSPAGRPRALGYGARPFAGHRPAHGNVRHLEHGARAARSEPPSVAVLLRVRPPRGLLRADVRSVSRARERETVGRSVGGVRRVGTAAADLHGHERERPERGSRQSLTQAVRRARRHRHPGELPHSQGVWLHLSHLRHLAGLRRHSLLHGAVQVVAWRFIHATTHVGRRPVCGWHRNPRARRR